MPIYETKNYEEVIARIQKKVDERNIDLGECLSEEVIVAFEEKCKIQLPQAYRLFLKCIGNGCSCMVDGFPLKCLQDIEIQDLSCPFMIKEAWVWEDDARPSSVISQEVKDNVYKGEIELINIGDGMSYNLIVTGKCRGEVWLFTDVGVQPCCERQDFLGWFELWLDYQDETDYFKDYLYE